MILQTCYVTVDRHFCARCREWKAHSHDVLNKHIKKKKKKDDSCWTRNMNELVKPDSAARITVIITGQITFHNLSTCEKRRVNATKMLKTWYMNNDGGAC